MCCELDDFERFAAARLNAAACDADVLLEGGGVEMKEEAVAFGAVILAQVAAEVSDWPSR